MEVYQNVISCRSLDPASTYQISGEYFKRFLSYHPDKQNPVLGNVTSLNWFNFFGKIFPGILNICAKFEEIPSTSKDAIGMQTCGAGGYGGPFCENSSHMQTSVPRGTLNTKLIDIHTLGYTHLNMAIFPLPSNKITDPNVHQFINI